MVLVPLTRAVSWGEAEAPGNSVSVLTGLVRVAQGHPRGGLDLYPSAWASEVKLGRELLMAGFKMEPVPSF